VITHIFSDDKESNTVRPLSIVLGVRLSSVGNALYDSSNRDWSSVKHPRLHRFLSHEVAFVKERKG
jgi:hypothetical protein